MTGASARLRTLRRCSWPRCWRWSRCSPCSTPRAPIPAATCRSRAAVTPWSAAASPRATSWYPIARLPPPTTPRPPPVPDTAYGRTTLRDVARRRRRARPVSGREPRMHALGRPHGCSPDGMVAQHRSAAGPRSQSARGPRRSARAGGRRDRPPCGCTPRHGRTTSGRACTGRCAAVTTELLAKRRCARPRRVRGGVAGGRAPHAGRPGARAAPGLARRGQHAAGWAATVRATPAARPTRGRQPRPSSAAFGSARSSRSCGRSPPPRTRARSRCPSRPRPSGRCRGSTRGCPTRCRRRRRHRPARPRRRGTRRRRRRRTPSRCGACRCSPRGDGPPGRRRRPTG